MGPETDGGVVDVRRLTAHRGRCTTYRELAGSGSRGDLLLTSLSTFEHRNLARLAALESLWEAGIAGSTLLHFDLHHDNVLVAEDGGVTIVDWGRGCTGQAWIDTVCLLLLSDTGAAQPEDIFARSSRAAGADPVAVDVFLSP